MPRTIVVTGGGTGIGRATAARFATAGDRVTILGRRPDVLARTADALGATAVVCDASDPAAVTAALPQLPDHVDVLVNCAGGNTDIGAPDPTTLAGVAAAWQANLDANLLSAVLVTTALTDRLASGGAVIQIGSIAADRGAASSYGAAKAALARWNVQLATDLGARDITANVVSCGYIEDTEFFGPGPNPRRDLLIDQTLVKRPGTPEHVAATIEFLAGPGGRQITAQVVNLNGGAWTTR
ncbi:SDR family oxidoreductase [Actinocatenispora rupis]|uniref:3-oxoacyl-ACP reductase n=1 Tax=Actinocatenispora rupis TaxID=519421 RepID=A0A8J3NBT8_9ACTN|nr:SDR family oxidoreductase [Actinocatenispora rupis]GID13401.1 3-oxoacyl-ACP reductase [Actinocatenispora rupis]